MLRPMKLILGLILSLLTALPALAEIYRGTDEDGNVYYSDKPQADAELIPTPSSNTVSMPKPEAKKSAVEAEKPTGYYQSFRIFSPENDVTVIDNTGSVTVSLSIEPVLNIENGDYFRLYLDNQLVSPKSTTLSTTLPNVARGSHSLKAELVSASGQTLLSHSVQFHMKRFSVLH